MKRLARVGAAAALLAAGCGRLVTKDPQTAARLNDREWTLRRVPVHPIEPWPLRDHPPVVQALSSPRDALGVPVDLYRVDPLLSAFRRDLEARADAQRKVGAGEIVAGAIVGGLSGLTIAVGHSRSRSNNPSVSADGNYLLAVGTAGAIVALGQIAWGLVLRGSTPSKASLEAYFRDTYQEDLP